MWRKTTLSIVLFLAVLAGILLWPKVASLIAAEGDGGGNARRGPQTTPVTVHEITSEAFRSTFVANGTLRAMEQIAVQPETAGRVVRLDLKDGAFVEEGDLLVKLDDALLQAELEGVESEHELARKTLQRQEDLVARDAVPQEAYDTARSRLRQLEAQIKRLQAQIDDTEIRAPFAGQLGLREISAGAYVTPSDVLTTLQSYETLRLDFSVPERYQGRIASGIEISLEVRGFSRSFSGRIVAMAPVVSPETRTLRYRAEVPNPELDLLPGNFARVSVPLEEFPEALMIPSMAILRDEASAYVFLAEDGKAVRQTVTIGIRTRDEVQIVEGLAAGDRVVVRGGLSLSDGAPIEIVEQQSSGRTEEGA